MSSREGKYMFAIIDGSFSMLIGDSKLSSGNLKVDYYRRSRLDRDTFKVHELLQRHRMMDFNSGASLATELMEYHDDFVTIQRTLITNRATKRKRR